jgi:uncharacterized protein
LQYKSIATSALCRVGAAVAGAKTGPAWPYDFGVADSVVRRRLERALRDAMSARDMIAVSALRSAMSAIDNAGAVSVESGPAAETSSPHFAGAAAGLGAGEAQRRGLSEDQVEEIVRAEIAEREAAAREYERRGHADQAERLRGEVRALEAALG